MNRKTCSLINDNNLRGNSHASTLRRVKPLAIAVFSVFAGMSGSAYADAMVSPFTISGSVTLSAGYNNSVQSMSVSTPASLTVTSTGIVNYPESTAYLYCNKFSVNGSNDNNSITIYGTVNGSAIYAGYLMGGFSNYTGSTAYGNVQVNNNTVTFKSGSSAQNNVMVYGGYVYDEVAGDSASASGNAVIIEKGSEFQSTYGITGGYASAKGAATASNNTVVLGSGTYSVNILGGHARSYSAKTATVSNNTVYLYGDADVSAAGIVGGDSNLLIVNTVADGATLTMTGNTLVFGYDNTPWSPSSYTVGNVQNFSTIRFDNAVWGETITVNYFANTSTDSTVTKVDATKVAFSGTQTISAGDSYKMLTIQVIGSGSIDLASTSSTFTYGTAVEGTGTVSLEKNNGEKDRNDTVVYTIAAINGSSGSDPASGGSEDPGIHASAQSHTAAMATSASAVALTQGADTTSSAAFNLAHSGMSGTQAFSSVGGGAARAKTGSHVTLNSLNFSVGVGNNITTDYGTLSVGGAFEAGYGRFKNHFDAGAADPYIKKSGHVSYYGVALLGNMEFTSLWHVNAALRYGRLSSKVSNGLYDAGAGRNYDIDISAYYLGVELGGGRIIKLDNGDSVDLYGKYFFLYQHGDSFRTSAETYDLDAVTSHRLRLAGRYLHSFTPKTSLYAGLGLEHEFDGKSKLKVKTNVGTFAAEPSEADGTRVFAEIGLRIVPEGGKGFNFDLGVKGLCGEKYRGAWATAEVKYTF